MSDYLENYIDEHADELIELGDALFCHPELGFREFETKKIIQNYLATHGLAIDKEYAYTGFSVTIGQGCPHIGLIAELDAIPTRGHPFADAETTAAHACGHSTQGAIMLGVMAALNEYPDRPQGTVTLYFTPAEEFTDMAYRRNLVKEGKVRYCSGKQNMLAEHIFDDADCLIHVHAMSGDQWRFSLGSVLSGFVYKKITFLGKASHAAALPDQGINALYECTLFLNAVNMLRETFRDEDVVRLHGIIDDGGNTVNSIPDKVVYECYVRSVNPDVIREVSAKVTRAAEHCAAALGGSCIVEDTPGYLPLHQSEELNEVILDSMHRYTEDRLIRRGEISPAAGDVGDVSMFKPIIQYGYAGFTGAIHGADLAVSDKQEIYILQPKVVGHAVIDLLEHPEKVQHIRDSFAPKMTYEEYIAYLDSGSGH